MRYTQGEKSMAVARYTLAVDRRRATDSGGQNTDFISCVAFDPGWGVCGEILPSGPEGAGPGQDPDRKLCEPGWPEDLYDGCGHPGTGVCRQPKGRRKRPPAGARADDGFIDIPDGIEVSGLPF